jgi:hypothetical protein
MSALHETGGARSRAARLSRIGTEGMAPLPLRHCRDDASVRGALASRRSSVSFSTGRRSHNSPSSLRSGSGRPQGGRASASAERTASYVYGFWPIDDDSWLRDLVYVRERWLVIRYEIVAAPGRPKAAPDQRVTARLTDPSWSDSRPTLEQAQALFKTFRPLEPAEPFATTELALEELADPTADDTLQKACRR